MENEVKKYNFIDSLKDEDAKKFAKLALCHLKELKNKETGEKIEIKTLEDAEFFLQAHDKFGHRKLPTDWKDGSEVVETTTAVEMGANITRRIYKLKKDVPSSGKASTISEILIGLKDEKNKFSFNFTFSKGVQVIFASVISYSDTTTTPYVLEETKDNKGVITVSTYSYFQDKYQKIENDANYRVMARVITTDLLQAWKGPITEEKFITNVLPGCDWNKKMGLRFFGELDRNNTITDEILKK